MPLRLNKCDSRVEENHDRLAFTRGPFVLCAESIDNEGATQRFYLDSKPSVSKANFSKVSLAAGSFLKATTHTNALTESGKSEKRNLSLVPYYAWNNRKPGSMTIWFPTNAKLAVFDPHKLPKESIFSQRSKHLTHPSSTHYLPLAMEKNQDGPVERMSLAGQVAHNSGLVSGWKPHFLKLKKSVILAFTGCRTNRM